MGKQYVGIVRRRLRLDLDTLEIGLQLILGAVQPVTLSPCVDNSCDLQPALLVDRGDPRFNSVFTRHGLYQWDRKLVLGGEAAGVIRALQLVESSPSFDRFQFAMEGD